MKYHRLTRDERYQIAALKESGLGVRAIARVLGKSASTISRELRRNSYFPNKYIPSYAHNKALKWTRRRQGTKLRIKGELKAHIEAKLKLDWSPEQIAGRLKLESKQAISYSTIYRFIYRDASERGSFYQRLRTKRKKRCRRQGRSTINERLVGRRSIHERPGIIEERLRIGDLERDTVRGKHHYPVLLTIVDRKTRRLTMGLLPRNTSQGAHKKTVSLVRREPIQTITNDNGCEFYDHQFTSQALNVPIYFCEPGKSSQRGTNENTNGLLRQYFPKNMDFMQIRSWHIRRVTDLLNNRPRKCLAYRTPNEVYRDEISRMLR